MSYRFNKSTYQDFGLIESNEANIYILPEDSYSKWAKANLYDFGWGRENGFYKLPMLEYEKLVELVFNSDDLEDKYGAAAMVLDYYPEELYDTCLKILEQETSSISSYCDAVRILGLNKPNNKSKIKGKSYTQIKQDSVKWKRLADKINSYLSRLEEPKLNPSLH